MYKVCSALDENNDGKIQFDEFLTLFEQCEEEDAIRKIEEADKKAAQKQEHLQLVEAHMRKAN